MTMTLQELVAAARSQITELNVAEVKSLPADVPKIDVREPAEFAAGSLPGAVNLPRGVAEFQIGVNPLLKEISTNHYMLVFCQSGGRSALTIESLRKLGYVNLVSLAGGLNAWIADGETLS